MIATGRHIVSTKKLDPELIQRLRAHGIELTQHNFIQKRIELPSFSSAAIHSTLVFTSQTAVDAWMELAAKNELDKNQYEIFCLQEGTLMRANRFGLRIRDTAPNAALLAKKIVATRDVRAITFFCGDRRRDELPSLLRAGGVEVNEVIVYFTELSPKKIEAPYEGVLFFSPSAIDSFVTGNETNSSIAFCIGTTTADHAKRVGFREIKVAKDATPSSVVTAVIDHFKNQPVHAEK